MFIVVSNNTNRIPLDLKDTFEVEQWTLNEFVTKASNDDGIDIDEGIYYDVSCLSEELYQGLLAYKDAGVLIVYYRFDDTPAQSFNMDYDEVKVYPAENKTPEPKEDEPVSDKIDVPVEPEKPEQSINPVAPDSMYGINNGIDQTTVLTSDMANNVPPVQNTPMSQPQVNNPMDFQPVNPQPAVQPQPSVQPQVQPQQQFNNGFDIPQNIQPQQPQNNPYAQNGSGQLYRTNQQQTPYTQPIQQNPYSMPVNNIPQDPAPHDKAVNDKPVEITGGVTLINGYNDSSNTDNLRTRVGGILDNDDVDYNYDINTNRKKVPAKVILFGSSKGGTGKTFTCLISAYRYAKTHPNQRIALADFDIIDGQIGITINRVTPTMQQFYNLYKAGSGDFAHLHNCACSSEHFSPNIDFYLAPAQDIPIITNDVEYWTSVFKLLITNYDVVFFDSGIDYLGKVPISQLYKIADRIIITCNPSINSVKSVIRQFKTLSGSRKNNVYKPSDNILDRVRIVLTRVYENQEINDLVVEKLVDFAPIVAAFGNIDNIVSKVQWYQQWSLIDNNPAINKYLDQIVDFEEEN